jgi:hypothetical protein
VSRWHFPTRGGHRAASPSEPEPRTCTGVEAGIAGFGEVGTSGSNGLRAIVVTARALRLPDLIWGSADGRLVCGSLRETCWRPLHDRAR